MIKKLCMVEIDLLEQLVKKYANSTKSNEAAISTLMSVKGYYNIAEFLEKKIYQRNDEYKEQILR